MENRTSDKNITNSRMDNIDVPVYQTDVENTHFEEYRLVYFDGKPPVNDNKYQYQSFGENKVVTETTSSEREQSLQRQRMIEDTMERVLSGTSSVIGSTCVMLIAILLVVNVFRPLAKKISKDFDVPMSIVHTSKHSSSKLRELAMVASTAAASSMLSVAVMRIFLCFIALQVG